MSKKRLSIVELPAGQQRPVLVMFRRQLAKWKLKMPRVKPLVLGSGLDDFAKTGLIEIWLANELKAGYCGKFLFVFDGQTCPYHHHVIKHETFFVMKGQVRMKVNGKTRILREGGLLAMATGTKHSFQGIGPALLLEVSQPSVPHDSYFQNKQIGRNGRFI